MRLGESFCPGILHAVPAKDGMLIRIRVPGGMLRGNQLKTVALVSREFADGQIEITSRANIQLRGIKTYNVSRVAEILASAELLRSAHHDRVRNIVTSPFAGFDPGELIDSRPFLQELDRRLLAEMLFTTIHPKFSFGIDGSGIQFSHETNDLALRALNTATTVLFQLSISGRNTGFAVSPANAVDCLLEAATACIALAKQFNVSVRGKSIITIPGGLEKVIEAVSHLLIASSDPRGASPVQESPLGIYPTNLVDHVCVVPSVPLGRLTAKQAEVLSEMAIEYRDDLRLAPWRGIVLGSVPVNRSASVSRQLQAVGLSCDGNDGFHGLVACAGSTGCDASLADVRSDASKLAESLSGRNLIPDWTVHLAGCEKQCAMRHRATVKLVANSAGYSLCVNGHSTGSILSPESALPTILSIHSGLVSEVAS